MVEANETITAPHSRPKIAPPTSVRIAAPGEREPGHGDVDEEEYRRAASPGCAWT